MAASDSDAVALDTPSFDELIDLLRLRLRDADAVNPSQLHSFKELMKDHADVIAPRRASLDVL